MHLKESKALIVVTISHLKNWMCVVTKGFHKSSHILCILLFYLIPTLVLFFTLAGLYQMAVWALGKHRNYKRDFSDYPKRKAIIPFVL